MSSMKTPRPSLKYPFATKRDIVRRLDDPKGEETFVRQAMEILHRRFVDRDLLEPPAGWMVSHRQAGESLYQALSSPECADADVARAATLVKHYARQVAKVLRDEEVARDPRLGLAAAIFGVRASHDVDEGTDPYAE